MTTVLLKSVERGPHIYHMKLHVALLEAYCATKMDVACWPMHSVSTLSHRHCSLIRKEGLLSACLN